MTSKPENQNDRKSRQTPSAPLGQRGPIDGDTRILGLRENSPSKKSVALKPDNVSKKTHMDQGKAALLSDLMNTAAQLEAEDLVELNRRARRLRFKQGREAGEAEVEQILADPARRPPKYRDRRSTDNVISFINREYGQRQLLEGFLTLHRLRAYDSTLESELRRFRRANPGGDDVNIPGAVDRNYAPRV